MNEIGSPSTLANQQATPRWPDGTPSIAVDIEVGKTHEFVDVDVNKYSALLTEMGVPSESQSEMSLLIKNRLDIPLPGASKLDAQGPRPDGAYYEETRTTEVALDEADSDHGTTLIHETRHAADHANGSLENIKIRRLVGYIKAFGKYAVATTVIPLEAAAAYGVDTQTGKVAIGLAVVAPVLMHRLIGRKAAIVNEYRTRPSEIRAYEAGRDPALRERYGNIITRRKR